jgi:hypothetical protein
MDEMSAVERVCSVEPRTGFGSACEYDAATSASATPARATRLGARAGERPASRGSERAQSARSEEGLRSSSRQEQGSHPAATKGRCADGQLGAAEFKKARPARAFLWVR